MSKRIGIPVAVLLLVAAIAAPVMFGSSDASDGSFYRLQLDANGETVFDSLNKLIGNYENTATVEVQFDLAGSVLSTDMETAKSVASESVRNALAAKYYSEPLIPHLWNIPVSEPEIEIDVAVVSLSGANYFYASSAKIVLTVPDDMADDPSTDVNELEDRMNKVNSAVKSVKVDSEKVQDMVKEIASSMKSVKTHEDKEGDIGNIYDALVTKESSSAGIAAAFTSICMVNGIDSVTVRGQVHSGSDSKTGFWNAVSCDGSWYAVDVAEYNDGNSAYMMAGTSAKLSDGTVFSSVYEDEPGPVLDNGLESPKLSWGPYPYPEERSLLMDYGPYAFVAVVVAVLGLMMLKAARGDGN